MTFRWSLEETDGAVNATYEQGLEIATFRHRLLLLLTKLGKLGPEQLVVLEQILKLRQRNFVQMQGGAWAAYLV